MVRATSARLVSGPTVTTGWLISSPALIGRFSSRPPDPIEVLGDGCSASDRAGCPDSRALSARDGISFSTREPIWANSSARRLRMSSRLIRPTRVPSALTTGRRRKPPDRMRDNACSIGAASETVLGFLVMTAPTRVSHGVASCDRARRTRSRSVRMPIGSLAGLRMTRVPTFRSSIRWAAAWMVSSVSARSTYRVQMRPTDISTPFPLGKPTHPAERLKVSDLTSKGINQGDFWSPAKISSF